MRRELSLVAVTIYAMLTMVTSRAIANGMDFNFFVEEITVSANNGLSYTDDFGDGIFDPPHPPVPEEGGYVADYRSTISSEDEYNGRLSLNSGDAVWAGPGNKDWVTPINVPVTDRGPRYHYVVPGFHFGDFSFTATFLASPAYRPHLGQHFSIGLFSAKGFGFFEEYILLHGAWDGIKLEDEHGDIAFISWSDIQPSNTLGLRLIIDSGGFVTAEYNVDRAGWTVLSSHVAPLDTDREYCAVLAGGAESSLNGEYWFGSLTADAHSLVPWSEQGEIIIDGNNWYQEWDDYDGHHSFSSTFTTSVQPDGSININHAWGSYNVAFNGNIMVHADTAPDAENHLGVDIIARKATNVDVNDVIGSYTFFAHWLDWYERAASVGWGTLQINADGNGVATWRYENGDQETITSAWTLDDVNGILHVANFPDYFLCEGGVISSFATKPGTKGYFGYHFFVKESNERIEPNDIAGKYLVRFLETSVFGQPFTCGKGTAIVREDGTFSVDAYYSDGEHEIFEANYIIGPGNKFQIARSGHVEEGIISPDKGLIFAPELQVPDEPEWWDWIGGIFLIRTVYSTSDLN